MGDGYAKLGCQTKPSEQLLDASTCAAPARSSRPSPNDWTTPGHKDTSQYCYTWSGCWRNPIGQLDYKPANVQHWRSCQECCPMPAQVAVPQLLPGIIGWVGPIVWVVASQLPAL